METPAERVPLDQVTHLMAVGEPLPFRVFDAQGRLLLNEGQKVLNDSQLQALVDRGAWVERSAVAALEAAAAAAAASAPATPSRRLSLFDTWEQPIWDLDRLFKATLAGLHSAREWGELVQQVKAMVDRDADVALYVAHRQEDRRFALYPQAHALHCAVLCCLAARQARWAPSREDSLMGAALTMNVAMVDLQARMAEQRDPPSPRQIEQIRAHPHQGATLLQAAGIEDPVWLEAVRDHHETPDGRGYPAARAAVSEESRVLRHADVYMAKITARAFRPALAPRVAAAQLFQQSGGDALAVALIRSVGVHPPGTLVTLASGEVAVILRRGVGTSAPVACAISDTSGRPIAGSTIRQTQEPAFAITQKPVDPAAFRRIPGERVYGWMEA